MTAAHVEEVALVGEEPGEPVGRFPAIEIDRRDRLTADAAGRHALDRGLGVRRVKDRPVGGPGAATPVARLRHRHRRTPVERQLLELAVDEEGDLPAVGRPEGERGPLGSGEDAGLGRTQSA